MVKKTKKNIKLRRRIRRTIGTVCLITALLVAMIPVPEAAAADPAADGSDGSKFTWDDQIWKGGENASLSNVPVIPKNCTTIYTTGEGTYQFAFVNESKNSSNKIAVILGYRGGELPNKTLTIPTEVDAYTKYNTNDSTYGGYVAVSRSQKPLFFRVDTEVSTPSGNDQIITTKTEYRPCYYADSAQWKNNELNNFYYYDQATDSYIKTESQDEQWIRHIEVAYIGNQSLTSKEVTGSGAYVGWEIAEESGKLNEVPEKGIFANTGNIVTLEVGDKLRGIGNYAFYGCSGIASVKFGNGLVEIGKSAFESCYNMAAVELNINSNITYISDRAFKDCRKLQDFQVPVNVKAIFDSAFEGCSGMKSMDLAGEKGGQLAGLQKMGYYIFKGCTSLERLTIPSSLTGDGSADSDVIWLNNFINCPNLRSITVQNSLTKIKPTTNFPVETTPSMTGFKDSVHSTFFLCSKDVSETHRFTKENAIAFKYDGEDKYEIILRAEAVGGGEKANITYQVNSANQLLDFDMDKNVEEIVIPSTVGPYGISAINGNAFSDNCFLKKIVISGTVTAINDNAFKGCHNLRHVIFTDAGTLTSIGTNAFATQVVEGAHKTGCPNGTSFLSGTPELTFTGKVGSSIVPFKYAMSAGSNINAGAQPVTYIKYYSGWPYNLQVQYNKGTGKAELTDYPTRTSLLSGKYNKNDYPYMTTDFEDAAKLAMSKYDAWLVDNKQELTSNEWDIVNSVLNISLPEGVTAIKTGLFSNAKGKTDSSGNYTGEVEHLTGTNSAVLQPDTTIESITMASISEFEPFTFSGCKSLHTINITGGAEKIDPYAFAYVDTITSDKEGLRTFSMTGGGAAVGDYAFLNNKNLADATLSASVSTLGLRPFKGCQKLTSVSFSGGPNFVTDGSIIFGLKDGQKSSLIECLEARGKTSGPSTINKTEIGKITEIAPEAFMDTSIGSVDLKETSVKNIPVNCFANTKGLYNVLLPRTCTSISKLAFQDSSVQYLEIPSSVTYLDPKAFNNELNVNSSGEYNTITFYCEPGSAAETFANEYESILVSDKPIEQYFTVIFWDHDKTVLKTQEVMLGEDATPPDTPSREGYRFDGWLPDCTNVSRNMDVVAQYTKIDSEELKHTVTFYDYDETTVLGTDKVEDGKDARPPKDPVREGYTFTGWTPSIINVREDKNVFAQYNKNSTGDGVVRYTVTFKNYDGTVLFTQDVESGKSAITPQAPTREGYKFLNWEPAVTTVTANMDTYAVYEKNAAGGGSGDGSGNGNGNGSGNGSATLYTLTVMNGSGSGSYVGGATVIIVANTPASTQQFSKWTTDNKDMKIASDKVAATTIVMPTANATITANFENKSGTNTGGGGTGNNGSGNTVTKNETTSNKGGTTVVIDKNGLSNTGVVSAVVNGSSDNFVIKITEDAGATEAALKALIDEYGSVDDLKYFPMDISLYDAKGEKKITDTTGITITITLPLPDSLIPYAGNNKVAGVVNSKLDKLGVKFTTINKVSCVTFTADHFSPYVIYVNTKNLSAGGAGGVGGGGETDDSPKTGDIQPKWFFVIGLCCMAVILFVKKDKVKVAARVQEAKSR